VLSIEIIKLEIEEVHLAIIRVNDSLFHRIFRQKCNTKNLRNQEFRGEHLAAEKPPENGTCQFLVRPSFIITIVIKRYKGWTIVFASVLSVYLSLYPHRRTYPNLVDLYIKLKVFFFYQKHENGGANFVQKTIKPKKLDFGGFFFTFSHTNEL
jgi:hypothetical protein